MRSEMIFLISALNALVFGCSVVGSERLEIEIARRAQIIDESTELKLTGAAFTDAIRTVDPRTNGKATAFEIRSESLSPLIEITTSDCAAQLIQFEVANVTETACSFEAYRLGEHPVDEGSRRTLSSLVDFGGANEGETSTPLVPNQSCETENVSQRKLRFTACLDWVRGRASVLPGKLNFEDCFGQQNQGTCIERLNGTDLDVSSQPLRARIRLSAKPSVQQNLVFGAVSNLAAGEGDVEELARSLTERGAEFLIVVGDVTSRGGIAEAGEISARFENSLNIPWFATLGDRDVGGNLGLEYLNLFGASSLAFEHQDIRFVLLDSATRVMKENEAILDDWLSFEPLNNTGGSPVAHLIFTHFPPFDAETGEQFAHGVEAGNLMSRLVSINAMALILGQRESTAKRRIGSVDTFDVGGSGDGQTPRWTRFELDGVCLKTCAAGRRCDCLQSEIVRLL